MFSLYLGGERHSHCNNNTFVNKQVAKGLPRWLSGKASTCQCRRHGFNPWIGKIPWRRKWQPTPLFTASDLASVTSHIHDWVLFLLWLHPFILSGVISPLISSSILGTYWPGGFIFQCPIFLPFHTVREVLKTRILNWFAILFSSGSCFVRTLHHDPSIMGGPYRAWLIVSLS